MLCEMELLLFRVRCTWEGFWGLSGIGETNYN
jgi:hypothetical protein